MKPCPKQPIVIRMGAGAYSAEIFDYNNEKNFHVDLASMTKEDRREFTNALVDTWSKSCGLKPPRRPRRRKQVSAA